MTRLIHVVLLAALLSVCGCISEMPTPPGAIPPAVLAPPVQTPPIGVAETLPLPQVTAAEAPATPVTTAVPATFRQAYARANQPRIAIFFNRALSDDVREWHTQNRLVVTGRRTTDTTGDTPESKKDSGEIMVSPQQYVGTDPQRAQPAEAWMWDFENGFLQPFLGAGASVVDRAVIVRLMAAAQESPQTEQAKKIEMDALSEKADIIAEILVRRAPNALHGYEFRAVAKEVQTGRIIASCTSSNWDKTRYASEKIIATSDGYKRVREHEFPRLQVVAASLAQDLMTLMADYWTTTIP
ncbi:MAG: hypothetical protein JXQ75_23465 [Phycisphaerae bacterium]|nr:hypothetical protein [Phycisphaerae bacterium]